MKLLFFTSDRQPGGMRHALDAYFETLCDIAAAEVHVLCPQESAFHRRRRRGWTAAKSTPAAF